MKLSRKQPEMFLGEKAGLDALRTACGGGAGGIVVPEVFYAGETPEGCERDGNSMIVMRRLDFGARGSQSEFGEALAKMHRAKAPGGENFGFSVHNTIGETTQKNLPRSDDWQKFWTECRLEPQLKLSGDVELRRAGERVIEKRMGEFFSGIKGKIRPSILHGDLWSGNIGTVDGRPSIFDPAVYYGHHEAEFGMSWCAGFSPEFWEAYWSIIQKDEDGYEERKIVYQTYHILNHYNMFGGGYRSQALGMLKQLGG